MTISNDAIEAAARYKSDFRNILDEDGTVIAVAKTRLARDLILSALNAATTPPAPEAVAADGEPLPCDVKVGVTTFEKGVAASTAILAIRRQVRLAAAPGKAGGE